MPDPSARDLRPPAQALLDRPGDRALYWRCVLRGSFIEPTQVKPGPALSSDVTPREGKAEFEGRSPYVSLGFNNSPLVRFREARTRVVQASRSFWRPSGFVDL